MPLRSAITNWLGWLESNKHAFIFFRYNLLLSQSPSDYVYNLPLHRHLAWPKDTCQKSNATEPSLSMWSCSFRCTHSRATPNMFAWMEPWLFSMVYYNKNIIYQVQPLYYTQKQEPRQILMDTSFNDSISPFAVSTS
jgi:hypothetical protein